MSDINTFSQFYYGHTVSNGTGGGLGNYIINFDEGSGELTAELNQGDYTLTEFGAEIKRAMDAVGVNTYTVTIDRPTRIITISADGNFDLLTNTGTQSGIAVYALMGYSTAVDKTGAATYAGDSASGSVYRPQAIVYDYVSILDSRFKQDAVVNVSASGKVQAIEFGDVGEIEMEIQPISDITTGFGCNDFFEPNASGVQDARDFMNYIITKAKIEFMEDRDDANVFSKILLEDTEASRNGTGFRLVSIIKGFYRTGRLAFREAIDL